MTTEPEEAKAVLAELAALHKEGWCACRSSSLPARVQASLGDLITALSTPPADDVREALASLIEREYDAADPMGEGMVPAGRALASVILSDTRFEVRLRGTVTDAEVEAGARVLDPDAFTGRGYGAGAARQSREEARRTARAVLKAVGEARS